MVAVPRTKRGPVVSHLWPADHCRHGSGFDLTSQVQAGSGDRFSSEVDRVSINATWCVLVRPREVIAAPVLATESAPIHSETGPVSTLEGVFGWRS
jgi:hypothetical protein